MKRFVSVAAALGLALLTGAGGAVAHDGAAAFMVVSADFVLPGQPFEVMVADIGEDAPVDFTLVKDARSELLGSTRAAPDGHVMTDLVVPADFPGGYAQLFATVPDAAWASTWVWVGERTADTPPPPSAAGAAPWWTDPSVIVLGVLLVGAMGVVGYLVFRPRGVTPKAVAAPSGPRRSSGKRSRR